ncbi:AT-rich interactive domain-containing protein 4 [Selaginella moellendorffii]|uniref:AT-rich interactive domain-containing protein 4 n=1 Tax=Selaginella moellendorffii TaxID=88036 RepID=UPI000D1CD4A0|nr:AT-rich interactive domain-containing protein 4 [Selaginella moellendorffii]XP_024522752.1 AT-rich interactive domain-containing protein 4 [Selaginella moellendorffii]|eukprot:XP_024522751.1 AT-rich interactive domain-containing protein 4 [Selaginella moellendorffii]
MSKALIGRGKPPSLLLAVQCGKKKKNELSSPENNGNFDDRPVDLASGGNLEIHFMDCPSYNEVKQKLKATRPEFLLLLGERGSGRNEVGSLCLGEKIVTGETLKSMIGSKLPEFVYIESSNSGKVADSIHTLGVRHVAHWDGSVTSLAAAHFRQSLVACLRTPGCDPWDAFELANASLEIHYGQTSGSQPMLLGEGPPVLDDPLKDMEDDPPLIQIYDEETEIRLLVCAEACASDSSSLQAVEVALTSLFAIEVRGMRLIHRISAPPPPSAASTFARGVVTMRCDLCTSSSARISLVVSGSAQTCFADHFLESTIRKGLMEKSQALQLIMSEDNMPAEIRRSTSIACGAAVVETRAKVPNWAAQTLRQLSTDTSYKTLVALGIAGIEGSPVAAFQQEDAERLGLLRNEPPKPLGSPRCNGFSEAPIIPAWLTPAAPTRKRQNLCLSSINFNGDGPLNGDSKSVFLAAMKPIPHATRRKLMPFAGVVSAGAQAGWSMKLNGNTKSTRPEGTSAPSGHGRGGHTFPIVLPSVKKHHCSRPSMLECPEEEFLNDVVQFLVSRGHGRLIPPTGIEAFPDVVLNGKRLDLYNLYREVVSRGGFRVGNGINWKGQIFSKMRNHTTTNRMTGVGNTLKKHYETYLLEYELAHDDVDGECCILCHSSAEGDWVNCGICGEWAHFGCDRRTGLATFKEYAKTDGLEYICPRCSVGSARGVTSRKKQRPSSGDGLVIFKGRKN